MTRATTTTELFEAMPRFPWRRPVRVQHGHAAPQYGCRICWGLAGGSTRTFATYADVVEHIAAEHPDAPGGDTAQ